tara:strand:+ start:391 stop:642 length:252 start_codon:yes stop_codon:yes gene_type:complete
MDNNTYIYATINIADLGNIDFSQVIEDNGGTIRKSISELEFIIKYFTIPTFISDGTVTPIATYDHLQCLDLMQTIVWQTPKSD